MADAIRDERLGYGGVRRADDIGIHHRAWWQSPLLALGILALLAVALLALWGRSRAGAERTGPAEPAILAPEPVPPLSEPPPIGGSPTPAPVFAPPAESRLSVKCDAFDVPFGDGQTTLARSQLGALDALADCLLANPDVKVTVVGRSDEREVEDRPQSIAAHRASFIISQLAARGVETSRVRPVVDAPRCADDTLECRELNRNVSIVPE
jgi:outer membrane protein OmpA-like peptidoglycan-associated protein